MAQPSESAGHELEGSDDDGALEEAIRMSLMPDTGLHDGDDDMHMAIQLSLMEHTDPTVKSTDNPRDLDHSDEIEMPDAKEVDFQLACQLAAEDFSDSSDESYYTYQPLPRQSDIRLMRLNALENDGDVSFALTTIPLDTKNLPNYTTLSYAWGKAYPDGSHLTHAVYCEGKAIMVTQTLHQALTRICQIRRRKAKPGSDDYLLFWVDSICIDQTNPEERRKQVENMAQIYARCHDMVIWLGEHSEEAITWLDKFYRIFPSTKIANVKTTPESFGEFLRLDRNKVSDPSTLEQALVDLNRHQCVEIPRATAIFRGLVRITGEFDSSSASTSSATRGPTAEEDLRWTKAQLSSSGYRQLLQRPWFRRKWVIQEVVQTSDKTQSILIADKIIPFREILDSLRANSLLDTASPMSAAPSKNTLLQNLAKYRSTLSSEPHDHIYALLGMSSDSSWVPVDYTLGAEELFTMVAAHYIGRGNVLAVFTLATMKKSSRGLLSWVPDWREEGDEDRSVLHTDALNTLSASSEKLFQPDMAFARNNVAFHQGHHEVLYLKVWVVSRCNDVFHTGDSANCYHCMLRGEFTKAASPTASASTDQSTTSRGKAPMREPSETTQREKLLSMRRDHAQSKWAARIHQQLQDVMSPQEVLCLLDGCPFGFVLWPANDCPSPDGSRTFRLSYCFQIDEEGWPTNWHADVLGRGRLEWICMM